MSRVVQMELLPWTCPQDDTEGDTKSPGDVSAEISGQVAPFHGDPRDAFLQVARFYRPDADLHALLKDFPVRWNRFIRANFRSAGEVLRVFPICERAARNWWHGIGGVNGGYVAIAMALYPDSALRILFGVE